MEYLPASPPSIYKTNMNLNPARVLHISSFMKPCVKDINLFTYQFKFIKVINFDLCNINFDKENYNEYL